MLADVVTRFTARYPAVTVDLHLTGRVVDLVAEKFDVALRVASSLKDSTLVARRVAPIVVQLFASPLYLARRGTPRSEAELAAHDWVAFRGGPQKLKLGGPREAVGVEPRERILCDDLLFVRDAIAGGRRRSACSRPSSPSRSGMPGGSFASCRALERPIGSLHVVTPAAKHVPRKVTAFRDLVVELLGPGARA